MKNTIKKFVKETLGCNCPDEVFEHIDVERNVQINDDIRLNAKINIGNRLLVYVVEIDDGDFLENNLHTIVSVGKEARDRAGFNRFRLVLSGERIHELEQAAHALFNELTGKEDKIHLHLVKGLLWEK